MKYIFIAIAVLLTIASIAIMYSMPDKQTDKPILYWVTDANPARIEQINIFQKWLKKHNYPDMELRLDTANRNVAKMIIQCVSGVGGDCMDLASGAGVRYFHSMGLLTDVTKWAKELNFDTSYTFKAMEPELTIEGKQYAFPCNVSAPLYWVNIKTFKKYKQPLPPLRWNFAEFERLGKNFVKAANKGKTHNSVFYANDVYLPTMFRSVGLSIFNETLTKCILNDPRYVQVLKLKYKWIYEDRILPSQTDIQSFSTESGYGGSTMQLFNSGNYAMFRCGRYALIQLRKFGKLELAVVHPPCEEFENTYAGTRCNGIYIGSKHKELAKYFLSFLASEDYNMQIVKDADALPPNPKYTKTEEFLHPKDYPNEWGCHKAFRDAMNTIAIPNAHSPFVLDSVASRIIQELSEAFMSNIYSAEETAKLTAERINEEIKRTLRENPELKRIYDERVKIQKQIDFLRKQNKKVPLKLISNPFYRKYYKFKHWSD